MVPRVSKDEGIERHEVLPEEEGMTVLELLSEQLFDVSTSGLRRIIRGGGVSLNDQPCSEDRVLKAGDRLHVEMPDDDEAIVRFKPAPLEGFSVLYEDASCLAGMKPAGTSVIAERGDVEAPFLGAVVHHLVKSSPGRTPRPRVVHRIDKETSGVVLLAKTREAMRSLSTQFQERTVAKEYLALVLGEPSLEQEKGEIDLPIGPTIKSSERRVRTGGKDAKPAETSWEVVERFRGYTLLRVRPHTGRQHQIRVHLEAIGFPLAVDPMYGGETAVLLSKLKPGYRQKDERPETPLLGRLSLHAAKLTFVSPATGKPVTVEAPLPHDFQVALKQLRKYGDRNKHRAPRRERG
jgi:23S rRNA pseudouridine1911/1915/1917 synthase